ncbi:MAG: YlxR family protein [Bacilli bacterium]|nr:YlxR family protein [Bacilli bacterium]
MKQRKVPLRTCALTKEKLDKRSLLRIVKNKDGEVFVDDSLKANGRGCYLKKDKEVIENAKKSRVLDRSLGIEVPENIYEILLSKL